MRQAVQQQLLDLNRRFYATVADEFDRTRQGLPEGMTTLAQILRAQLPAPPPASWTLVAATGAWRGRWRSEASPAPTSESTPTNVC